jgi:uncharacterized membrane protein
MASQKINNGGLPKEDLGILFLFSYFLFWISGIIVFILYGNKDKRLRFHAIQAVVYGIAITIFDLVFGWLPILGIPIHVASLLLWVYGLYVGYMASRGKDILMPIIGAFVPK